MTQLRELPSVTPAHADELAALGLHTTTDLLRTERGALVRRVPGLNLSLVKEWQSVAELLQLEGITLETAVALHAAGCDTIDELTTWTLQRLRQALTGQAVEDERLFSLAKDAVRLRHTGVVNGNVRLSDGTPVADAAVVVAGRRTTSDARGRFRVIGLEPGREVAVAVTHPDLGSKLVKSVRVLGTGALQATTILLSGRRRAQPVLTQRRGDSLPPIGSSVITTRAEAGPPPEDDVLIVAGTFANGDVRVASEFLDFEDGEFVRRLYRLASGDIPAEATVGVSLIRRQGIWQVGKHCSHDVARRVRVRAAVRRLGPQPATVAEAAAQARAVLRAASEPGRRTR